MAGVDNKILRVAAALSFICFLAVVLETGCGRSESPSASADSSATNSSEAPIAEAQSAPIPAPEGPGAGEKICFECNGRGSVPCMAKGCRGGKVDCPGPCLKLDQGVWTHMNVAGHPATDLWRTFVNPDRSTTSWNQGHVGQVVVMQNGHWENLGQCTICGGTGTVTCPVCKGTGIQTCPICEGKKYVAAAWTPTDNPWFNRQPDVIRLKDGRVFLGKVAFQSGTHVTIVTRGNEVIHADAADVLPPHQ